MTTHTEVYKVTNLHDRSAIFSWLTDKGIPEERIQYSTRRWATALPHSGLFCFGKLEDAKAFCEAQVRDAKIWIAIARHPCKHDHVRVRDTAYRTRSEIIANWQAEFDPFFDPFRAFPWPEGTLTFEQVRLVRLHSTYSNGTYSIEANGGSND